MTREEWKMIEKKLAEDYETLITHVGRCEEQGHQYENCCSATFQIYKRCKWCGEPR